LSFGYFTGDSSAYADEAGGVIVPQHMILKLQTVWK
jgi:hypothetical protein